MNEVQADQTPEQDRELDRILSLYEVVFTKFNQEGDGIWDGSTLYLRSIWRSSRV